MRYIRPYVSTPSFTRNSEGFPLPSHYPATQKQDPSLQDGSPLPNFSYSPNPLPLRPKARTPERDRKAWVDDEGVEVDREMEWCLVAGTELSERVEAGLAK